MKPKMIAKICVDIGITIALLLLMTYELIGQAVHEWLGIGMFVLFLTHHILNRKWTGNLLKGSYTPLRIWQTLLVVFVMLCMIGSMMSGIILSRHALSFLPINGGRSFARSLHMVSAYWGFVWMSLHLGLHWSMMMAMARKAFHGTSSVRTRILRILAAAIAIRSSDSKPLSNSVCIRQARSLNCHVPECSCLQGRQKRAFYGQLLIPFQQIEQPPFRFHSG